MNEAPVAGTLDWLNMSPPSWKPSIWETHLNACKTPPKKIDIINTSEDLKFSEKYKYKKLSKYIGLLGSTRMVAPFTYVGVEIELEHCNMHSNIPSTWNKVEDNSLKLDGMEYVTRPIQVKYLEVELLRLFNGVRGSKPTSRCSVHIHLNVRDFTLVELEKFLILYLIFERSLYRISGDRWCNNFCVPLYNYPVLIKSTLHNLSKGVFNEEWYKYHGLNISPIFGGESSKLGTIEFRHLRGTKDIGLILLWINLIVSLKIAAKRLDVVHLEQLALHINDVSDYNNLSDRVFQVHSNAIKNQPTFKEDMEMCIAQLKYCLFKCEEGGSVEIPITKQGVR